LDDSAHRRGDPFREADLESGDLDIDASTELSWLRGVLAALKVPESSQVMVFSKTSLQRTRISPDSPRVLYFNDEVYVGWVPGGAIELAAMDPAVGPVFFLLERPAPPVVHAAGQTAPGKAVVIRDQECLSCHAGPMTGNVPGYMIRSVYPDAQGNPILTAGTKLTGHHSPIEQRWGGWYVTGSHDPMRHLGNALARETPQGADLDMEAGANATSLAKYFDVTRYPLDQSDIVALMVLEHQVNLQTMMTQAHYAVKSALYREDAMRREMPDAGPNLGDSTRRIITHEAVRLIKNMLFADEAPLASEGVASTSSFPEDFVRGRPARRRRSVAQNLAPRQPALQKPLQLPDLFPVLRRPAATPARRDFPPHARSAGRQRPAHPGPTPPPGGKKPPGEHPPRNQAGFRRGVVRGLAGQ
jgi:hypothetical protein